MAPPRVSPAPEELSRPEMPERDASSTAFLACSSSLGAASTAVGADHNRVVSIEEQVCFLGGLFLCFLGSLLRAASSML